MTIISTNLVLTADDSNPNLNANSPAIGYHNLVTVTSVTAGTADTNYPVTNLANPMTFLEWRAADNTTQYLTIDLAAYGSNPTDYVAIAKHNWSSAGITISLEGSTDGTTYPLTLISPQVLASDEPLIMRYTPQILLKVRVKFVGGTTPARAAVAYAGKLLTIERNIYVGHTPMPYGRKRDVVNGRSESGNFLGRVVTGEKRMTSVSLENLRASWHRTYLDPFFKASAKTPFFFAWRPGTYPTEVGYGWMPDDPTMSNQRSNGMVSASFNIEGIA